MADSIKIVEDIEMAQETNEEEKKGSGPSRSSRISTENSEKLKINELFNNNLKGLVNELIGSEIASEFDERIWVQSVEEDSSSKLSDLFRESDDGLIIIQLCLDIEDAIESCHHWHEQELHAKVSKRRKGQHLDLNEKLHLIQLLRDYRNNHKEIKFAYKLSETTFKRLKWKIRATVDSRKGQPLRDSKYNLLSDEAKLWLRIWFVLPVLQSQFIKYAQKSLPNSMKHIASTSLELVKKTGEDAATREVAQTSKICSIFNQNSKGPVLHRIITNDS